MDVVRNLSREAQIVLGGAVLYLIFSFLDWQQVSVFGHAYGLTLWHGIGVVAGLLVIALLLWEAGRLFEVKVQLGTLSAGLVSVALALLLALFTVIAFLNKGTARHWPAWIGLLLGLVIAMAAVARARAEGVEIPRATSSAAAPAGDPGPPVETPPEAPPAPEE
ncbi:MAG TPA: hypothetical protein VE984_10305 [Gaiellaceae bacterium]|nr:hypothetical protein [Gaiellaceae bacterium]